MSTRIGGRIVNAAWDLEGVVSASVEGKVIAEYAWPPAGSCYVGKTKVRTRFVGEGLVR